MDSEPAMDFNFLQVMKSIQAIEIKTANAKQQLNTAKLNLEKSKKERDLALVKCEDEDYKSSQYNKEMSLLAEKIPRKHASIDKLTRQIENNHVKTEDVKWRQTKAKLVLESERARSKMYQRIMDKHVEERESDLEVKSASQISVARAEREQKKEALEKRKEFLQTEITKMENMLKDKKKLITDIGSEASVLKKRNCAVLIRMRRKLQESEARRRGLMASLEESREMAKRARPTF